MPELFDFGDGAGPVPAHCHHNPDGSVGGWVADTADVGSSVYVSADAQVFQNAVVEGHSFLADRSRVFGYARMDRGFMCGESQLFGYASVSYGSSLHGQAKVFGEAKLEGHVEVRDRGVVRDRATLMRGAVVRDDAVVSGQANLDRQFVLSGSAVMTDNAVGGGRASVSGDAVVCGSSTIYGDAQVYGSARISGVSTVIKGDSRVYGNAEVEDSTVSGSTEIYGDAVVRGAFIEGSVKVCGYAKILDGPKIMFAPNEYLFTMIAGNVRVFGQVALIGRGLFYIDKDEWLFAFNNRSSLGNASKLKLESRFGWFADGFYSDPPEGFTPSIDVDQVWSTVVSVLREGTVRNRAELETVLAEIV